MQNPYKKIHFYYKGITNEKQGSDLMEDLKLYIIDNTAAAQKEFGHMWGSGWYQITMEQIEALKNGKQLAFSDGEYVNFISLSEPE